MLLETGKLASIAARFDRMVTKMNMDEPREGKGLGGRSTKTVLHYRKDGLDALVRFPNGVIAVLDNKTIVHSYDSDGKLIYRKRINENPPGLEVDSGLKLRPIGWETHEFLQKRKKELGW